MKFSFKTLVICSILLAVSISQMTFSSEIAPITDVIQYDDSISAAYLSLTAKNETSRKGITTTIMEYPGNITIINKNEIQKLPLTPTASVADILRYMQGAIVKDWTGQGKTVNVDLRGFGETAPQNTTILINGRRIDNIDMASVDWTQIPIDTIERIEILHGPNSVLYGDNATGGVINIITNPPLTSKKKLTLSAGSYNSGKLNLNLTDTNANNSLFYKINLGRNFTDGARENSAVVNTDIAGNFGYQHNGDNGKKSILLDFGYHTDKYGLPGALSEADWIAGNFTKALNPNDEARTSDGYLQTTISLPLKKDEITNEINFSYRNRNSDSYWRAWLMGENRNTSLYGAGYKLIYNNPIVGNIIGGIESIYGVQKVKNLDQYDNPIPNSDTDLKKNSLAFYLSDEIKTLKKKLTLTGGIRYELANYSFLTTGSNEITISSGAWGYNIGANYLIDEKTSLYTTYSSAFRMPKVDEYYSAWSGLNNSLLIQITNSIEIGTKHIFSEDLSGNINLFQMDTQNEIYYNPAGGAFGFGANENYTATRRLGMECGLTINPVKSLATSINYTYTDGKITDGIYKNSTIPSVPLHTASLSTHLILKKGINATLTGNYVGERYFISDQKNISPMMPSYIVINSGLSWKVNPSVKISGGINNIFNEKYAEYGVANIAGTARNYYPAPGRNFFAGVEVIF